MVTATDYYPFGMQMPGRYMADTGTHCYTTTITEPVDYFNFTYYAFSAYPLPVTPYGGAYLYSLLSGDQQLNTFGHPGDSLVINIDSITPGAVQCLKLVTDGCTNTYGEHIISGGVNVGSSTISYSYGGITTIYFLPTTPTVTLVIGELFSSLLPHAHFDLNLRGIYLPRFDSAVMEDVVTSVCNEDRYHYGFNGQMKVNEWAGVGNHVDFGARGLDTRTGRWQVPDELFKKYPSESPYAFVKNTPIQAFDPNGKEIWIAHRANDQQGSILAVARYSEGKLTFIIGNNNDPYVNKVAKDITLDKGNGDKDVKNVFHKLDVSKDINIITNVDTRKPGYGNHERPLDEHDRLGDVKGTLIEYNPDDKTDDNGAKREPRAALGHEIKHAYNDQQGEVKTGKTNGIKNEEIDAVNFENKIRKSTGDPKRTRYDDKEIPASKLEK